MDTNNTALPVIARIRIVVPDTLHGAVLNGLLRSGLVAGTVIRQQNGRPLFFDRNTVLRSLSRVADNAPPLPAIDVLTRIDMIESVKELVQAMTAGAALFIVIRFPVPPEFMAGIDPLLNETVT